LAFDLLVTKLKRIFKTQRITIFMTSKRQKEKTRNIVIASNDKDTCGKIAQIVQNGGYPVIILCSFIDLEIYLHDHECLITILDLGSLSVDNRQIKELALKHHSTYFLGLTEHRLNPELEESICYYLYACIAKPVDQEELLYWIRSIWAENTGEQLTKKSYYTGSEAFGRRIQENNNILRGGTNK